MVTATQTEESLSRSGKSILSPPMAGSDGQSQPTPINTQLAEPLSRVLRLRHAAAQPVVAAFLAGGVAGAVSRTVVSPLERLKILFQVQDSGKSDYKLSVPKALRKIWQDEGFKGMMRGNGTNCVRIVPYSAVQFSSYNIYKRVRFQHPFVAWVSSYSLSLDVVFRTFSWSRSHATTKTGMWSFCRHHLSHVHLSP